MKSFSSTLRFALFAMLLCVSPLYAQWNTLAHDAVTNRSINDLFFMSNTGYAVGMRSDGFTFGSHGMVYKTTDGGQTWNMTTLPLTIGTDTVMSLKSVQFVTPSTGFVTAICYSTNGSAGIYYGALLKTTDGGATWTSQLSMKNQITYSNGHTTNFDHVFFSDMYHGIISGSKTVGANAFDGIDYVTYNGGNSWSMSTAWTGIGVQAHASFFFSNGTGSIVGGKPMSLSGPYNGRIAQSTDGGNTWTNTFTDNSYGYVDVQFPNSQIGYAIGDSMYFTMPGDCNGKLVKTTNGGSSWTAQAYFNNFMPLCVYFTSATTGYIGGETAGGNSALLKTTDGGATWNSEVYPDIANASYIPTIAFSTPVSGYTVNDWTSSNSIYGSFTQACGVYLGPDTSFCQTQGQLFATPATPGSNYVFNWSPGTGLSDSTSQSPNVSFVSNQQYVVTMTDTVTNCVATDTIVVSSYNAFAGNVYSCFPDSTLLDLGPGAANYFWQYFTDTNGVQSSINQFTQTLWATEPGSYLAIANFTGCGNLTSMFTVVDSCFVFTCGVNAGPDTTFCQNHGQLHATPASPGNYTFAWSPATGLDDPNIQNPTVISGVNNQQYVVTMTDNAQSCITTDTVIVSAHYIIIDTVYSCNNQPVTIDLGPGGTQYTFMYTDTAGNGHTGIMPNQYFVAIQPVIYYFIGFFPGCGALTSYVTVIDSCNVSVGNVWPGDCNYDLSVNMADALHIGLAYNTTGPVRPSASNLWYAQPMSDWVQNYSNCNYKHGDANGDGMINVNDTLPISLNYGNTHPYRMQPVIAPASAPQLYLVANYDTVGLQTLVTVDIRLGTNAVPVDSLYGISFRISTDDGLIDTNYTVVNLNSTWLGTMNGNMFGFRKYFNSFGMVDVAECGKDHLNRLNGSGSIGSFLIVTTDNLSGIATCHFNVSDITAVTVGQNYLTLNSVSDSVVIDPSRPAGIQEMNPVNQFTVYPNPANENVTVKTHSLTSTIEICDLMGRTITTVIPYSSSTTINTSTLAEGVYLLKVKNGNSISTQKLSITH
jgi:photosystem II stability/assembly factor-like uncharacterized protein